VPPLILREASLTIRGRAEDDTAVSAVTVNGEVAVLESKGAVAPFLATIVLRPGENRLAIHACDTAKNCSARLLMVRYVPPSQLYDQLWAVVIGIDRYQLEDVQDLQYAVKDAQAVGAMLRQQGFTVRELYNEHATAHAIRTVLGTELAAQVGERDGLLVFFAGHGEDRRLPDGGVMGYLLPHEANPANLHATAIDMEEVRRLAKLLPAKHVLFLVDACYGGIAATWSRSLSAPLTPERLRALTREPGRHVITAGGAGEQVVEGPKWGHSVFTYFLLRGLGRGYADPDEDGMITTQELAAYLQPRVWQESTQRQKPVWKPISAEQGEFVFVLLGKK
jgi:uncharacterized caspase-like protein